MNAAELCTCTNFRCPWHPRNHDQGCTLCIAKNLKHGEIPSCFFNKLEPTGTRPDYKFEDFARLVMEKKEG